MDVFEDLGLSHNIEDTTTWDVIHDYDEFDKAEEEAGTVGLDPSDPGPFLPMWQTSPLIVVDPPYNWDLLSAPVNQTALVPIERQKVSISEAYLVAFPNDTEMIEENMYEAEWVSAYLTTDEDAMEPMSDSKLSNQKTNIFYLAFLSWQQLTCLKHSLLQFTTRFLMKLCTG